MTDQHHEQAKVPVAEYGIGAALCFAFGAVVVLAIKGVLGVEKYAPDWILWIVAAALLVFGILLVISAVSWSATWAELARRTRFALGIALLGLFLILSNWAAFGPGERTGTSSFSIPFWSATRKVAGIEARIIPAICAILLDLIVAGALVRDIRKWRARRHANLEGRQLRSPRSSARRRRSP